MTRLRFEAGKHRYWLRHDGGPEERLLSVTTLLGLLDKPGLPPWYARQAAAYAVDHWDELAAMPLSQRSEMIAGAPRRRVSKRAAEGTQIHAWAEALLAGQPVEIPDQYLPQVQAFARWFEQSGFASQLTETLVWCEANELLGAPPYAGMFDCLALHERYGLTLIDWKTSPSGPWPTWALQVAAYASATWLVRGDDDERMPKIDTLASVKILADESSLYVLDETQRRLAVERWDAVRALAACVEPEMQRVVT